MKWFSFLEFEGDDNNFFSIFFLEVFFFFWWCVESDVMRATSVDASKRIHRNQISMKIDDGENKRHTKCHFPSSLNSPLCFCCVIDIHVLHAPWINAFCIFYTVFSVVFFFYFVVFGICVDLCVVCALVCCINDIFFLLLTVFIQRSLWMVSEASIFS